MELVFATHNLNKAKEILLQLPSQIHLITLRDIGCLEEIQETASTLQGNALLKASYVKEKYGFSCFADDTGLEVLALEGAPGVYSARYAGEPKNEAANMAKLLNELKGKKDRRAQFTTVIALCSDHGNHFFKGEVKGLITEKARGSNGFGYDPVFQPEGFDRTFAELSLEEKNQISHRARAFSKLLEFLRALS
ncbi:non-canonical purine NTP diphosphatase [Muriicola soli]|uniref:dITP/XTP pyrophosphatase n=1 Tax=Muriicola soli TaxID=2507538 RepID=A0A411E9N3_9FLAO|nr:non-canonical purine NTP diphosphatase [Muriicola soli]QBA64421.1 non-canonical purine NTP diphosphatase [Muriicola soli]